MIDYETFEKQILFLKRQNELNNKVRNLFREYSDVVLDIETPIEQSWFQQIDLLELLLGIEKDEAGYSTLLWWVQEQEFGAKPGIPLMKDVIGCEETFDFSTIRGIYDYLMQEADWSFRQRILQDLNNHPIEVEDIDDGFVIRMSPELYSGLTEIMLKDHNMTLEESLRSFIEWCVKEPEEFVSWIRSAGVDYYQEISKER